MKKSLFIIAAAVALFAACEDNDTFRKDLKDGNSNNNGAIGFTSFTEKVTKAENSDALYSWSFYDHQETFLVWARKNNQPTQEIFNGDTVFVTEESGVYKYTYAPDRYWDKLADKYNFYAAAPAPAEGAAWEWKFNDGGITNAETIDKGYFTIEDNKFSLNGVNLQSVENADKQGKYATESLRNSFKTATNNSIKDVDLLIADETPVARSFYNKANPDAVNLNFIHILSKLNITISTSLDKTGNNKHVVDLLAFEVKNVPNTGSFDESKTMPNDKKAIRWTLDNAPSKISIPTGINAYNAQTYTIDKDSWVPVPHATDAKKYIVESLIIPQEIKYQRVALDGKAHNAVNENVAAPYANYEAYEAAKHNDGVDRLPEVQFNALIKNGAFVDWEYYNSHRMVPGETDDRISQTEFNSRVALATKEGTTPYADYTEFNQAVAPLTSAQFNALISSGAFVRWADYNHTAVEGETDDRIDEDAFDARVAEATKEGTTPYTDFDEYSTTKGENATLTEAQFNALINNGAFVDWADYTPIDGEKDNRIDQATFNSRVATATKTGTTPYSDFAEFALAKAPLSSVKFNALINNGAFWDWDYYNSHRMVPGETDDRIPQAEFERRVAEATATSETHIPAYLAPSEPYFIITYSVDDVVYTGNYNLAAAFLNMHNNELEDDDETEKDASFKFYEGWQNTLNIIIQPTAIKFTADVAKWSDNADASYEIEKGNENPNN